MARTRSSQVGEVGYLSININDNEMLPGHRDVNNLSSTWVCATGDYRGGLLWVQMFADEVDDQCVPMPPDLQGKAPPNLVGKLYDPYHDWVVFDGDRWHCVLPAYGRRISVSLFTPRGYRLLEPQHWQQLYDLGFVISPLLKVRLASMDAEPLPVQRAFEKLGRDVLRVPTARRPTDVTCSEEFLAAFHDYFPCNFCDFARECQRLGRGDRSHRSDCDQGPRGELFPCGLPFFATFVQQVRVPTSRRRAKRWRSQHTVHTWPSRRSAGRACGLSDAPHLMPLFDDMLALVTSWCRSTGRLPKDGGLSHLHTTIVQRLAQHGHVGSYSGACAGDLVRGETNGTPIACPTVCLAPGAMSLPAQSATIKLVFPTVPKIIEKLLHTPGVFLRTPQPSSLAPSFTHVSWWSEVALELLHRGLGELRPVASDECFNGKRVYAGLFGVPKKDSDLARIIIDRRPQNSREMSIRETLMMMMREAKISVADFEHLTDLMTLPYPGQFTRILLPPGALMLTSAEDAADYYYNLSLPDVMRAATAVGAPLSEAEVVSSEAFKQAVTRYGHHARWRLHLTAPPMGDVKAPDIAQCAHSQVALRCGGLSPQSWMRYKHMSPGGSLWAGCYVDDYGLLALVHEHARGVVSAACTLTRSAWARQRLHAGYRETGISRKVEKAKENEKCGQLWGAKLDTATASVYSPVEKRQLLVLATIHLCRLPTVHAHDVQPCSCRKTSSCVAEASPFRADWDGDHGSSDDDGPIQAAISSAASDRCNTSSRRSSCITIVSG
eukprot:2432217-Amphidinium_carterae.2